MIFFTRELFDGMQLDSGWERRATGEWRRRAAIYWQYLATLRPMLPRQARKLSMTTLHDAVVTSATQRGKNVRIVVDARKSVGAYRGKRVELVFRDVGDVARKLARLKGAWWLYEEFHLASADRFRMTVLFDDTELELEAADLVIKVTKATSARTPRA